MGGVKIDKKTSDIIYVCSLSVFLLHSFFQIYHTIEDEADSFLCLTSEYTLISYKVYTEVKPK